MRFFSFAVLLLALAALGCGGKDHRGGGGGRGDGNGGNNNGDGRNPGDVGDGRDGDATSDYTCYDAGYADCYYYYEADPSWWGCGGNADQNDYWDGYCDCEYDFYATYYCGSTYYTTY